MWSLRLLVSIVFAIIQNVEKCAIARNFSSIKVDLASKNTLSVVESMINNLTATQLAKSTASVSVLHSLLDNLVFYGRVSQAAIGSIRLHLSQ